MFGILSAIALCSLKGAATWFGDAVLTAGLTVPIIILGGVFTGTLFGYLLTFLTVLHHTLYVLLTAALSLACLYTTMQFSLSGLAYIAILLCSVISIRSRSPSEIQSIRRLISITWRVVEIVLFGLVGASMDVTKLDGVTVCYALLTIFLGVVVKFTATMIMAYVGPFSLKEKVHISLCRLSKATVQASLGNIIFSQAQSADDEVYTSYGTSILTTAAIAIMTSTVISISITTLAPYLLTQSCNLKPEAAVLPLEETKEEKERMSEGLPETVKSGGTLPEAVII